MLTEKSALIKEISRRKIDLENGIKAAIDMNLICHIADVFKECGEAQVPYGMSQNFSESLDKALKDTRL